MKSIVNYFLLLLPGIIPVQSVVAHPIKSDSLQRVPLTLNQVWEKAASYNKAVQMKELRLQSSAEQIKDAKAERLPEISAEGEYARISNMPVYDNGIFKAPSQFEVLHSTYSVGADAYLNLYNGNKLNIEIDARKSENKIAAEQKRMTVSEAKLRAAAYYLDMQRSIIFKDLLLKDIAAQEKQLLKIEALKTNGVVLKSDVLRAELKLSKQKLSLVQLNNDLAIANQKLNILIGLPDDEQIDPVTDNVLDSINLKSNQDYLTTAGSNSYQIKISAEETELRKLQLKNVKANVSPKVGLFAEYKYSYPQIFLYPYSPYIYGIGMAGVKASFSISSFYHNYHKAKVAKLEYESQEIEHAQTQDNVRQQVNEAYLRFKEALNRVDVSKTNIRQAQENRRIVSNTYFNQTSLITDLLDADTQLLQTRFDLAAAEIAAQLQYYQLQNVTGNL
ncbi:TolC family protein [Mucilaginibacter sp. SP1R1]|uniref:TolC family protein n=1 Tax=Mucilaginibacter sp. SP1R1 TaxID=2723091 RepID=UPI001607540C|nr:TolC family protein [Mucilaginibacter sp. SP1R1]MBB6152622.1 outer membrane protein TolC [Mucilaginibacter sp. SP1R1]